MANILLGVTGSISAYKSLDIISGLIASGHDVKVVISKSAEMFVTKMSLATISKNEVYSSLKCEVGGIVHHIELGKWADCLVIAPATANTISKIAHGGASNMLLSCILAFPQHKPRIIAPAMNTNMLINVATHTNIDTLTNRNYIMIDTIEGMLACGAVGYGKLEKPRKIVEVINKIMGEYNA